MSTTLIFDEQPPTPTDADADRAVLAWFPDGSGCWGIGTTKQEAQTRAVELRREWDEPPAGWAGWAKMLRFVVVTGAADAVREVLCDLESAQGLLDHHNVAVKRTDKGLDDDGLDDDDGPDDAGLDDDGLDDDEGLDDDDGLDAAWIAQRIDTEIEDELRYLAALGLSPLQWIGVFFVFHDYATDSPCFWHSGGLARLETLGAMRRRIAEDASPDRLLTAGARAVIGCDDVPDPDDAARWEAAWDALRPHELAVEAGPTATRRAFFDSLNLPNSQDAAYEAFCDLLGGWSVEVADATRGGAHDRPRSPTLKQWLARTDAAHMLNELAKVQHDYPVGRTSLWRDWGGFIGINWAIRDGLPWAVAISKGGE